MKFNKITGSIFLLEFSNAGLEAVSFSGWSERRARKSLLQAMRAGQIWSLFLLVNPVPGFGFRMSFSFLPPSDSCFPLAFNLDSAPGRHSPSTIFCSACCSILRSLACTGSSLRVSEKLDCY
jgi:hypothetical protein